MIRSLGVVLGVVLLCTACTTSNNNVLDRGVCEATCPKPCNEDTDCDTAHGELCCDYGSDGKACSQAMLCPRFCTADTDCDTPNGEGCERATLLSSEKVCEQASKGMRLCSSDTNCNTANGEVCCTVFEEPICLAAGQCPTACNSSVTCSTAVGDVCCKTLASLTAVTVLRVSGLCVAPTTLTCPNACTKSSNCNTAAGELCCNGICSTSCVKECSASSDCPGQICCKTRAVQSVWLSGASVPYIPTGPLPQTDAGTSQGDGGGSQTDGGTTLQDGGGTTPTDASVVNCSTMNLATLSTPCNTCLQTSCCTQLAACVQAAECAGCFSIPSTPQCNGGSTEFTQLTSAATASCATPCNL